MDCEVSNGSGLRDECVTNLLVFGFLQSCSDNSFRRELDALGRELPVPAAQWEAYDELQTDGNRSSHSRMGRIEADSESQEDVIRNIARHLAQVGDSMDRSIPPGLVNGLALQLRNTSRSEEDRNRDLATALEQLLQAYPTDMEKEKTMLVLALLLAKKVASHTPSLLRDVFQTTVNFINQNLRAYVRSLARNVRTHEVSPFPACCPCPFLWKVEKPSGAAASDASTRVTGCPARVRFCCCEQESYVWKVVKGTHSPLELYQLTIGDVLHSEGRQRLMSHSWWGPHSISRRRVEGKGWRAHNELFRLLALS
uniref:BH3-interacting domain death agonist n=2 Tax=Macaca TaxID=9539 RepID=F6WQU1_MACMU